MLEWFFLHDNPGVEFTALSFSIGSQMSGPRLHCGLLAKSVQGNLVHRELALHLCLFLHWEYAVAIPEIIIFPFSNVFLAFCALCRVPAEATFRHQAPRLPDACSMFAATANLRKCVSCDVFPSPFGRP